jgi:ABC-type multidrug transport system ATPase subunit
VRVLDEPTAGLDELSAERVREALREEARDHITLIISHENGDEAVATHHFDLAKGVLRPA